MNLSPPFFRGLEKQQAKRPRPTFILKPLVPSIKMVEYGCGIAPVTNYIIEHRNELGNLTSSIFVLVDVEGEHLEFAKWRLQKKAPDLKFVFHQINLNLKFFLGYKIYYQN